MSQTAPYLALDSLIGCVVLTLAAGVGGSSLPVAGLTHADRTAAPAPLWNWHPVAGAGMAETLAARSTVMLPVRLLELLLASMTGLTGQDVEGHGRVILVQKLCERL